MALSAGIDREQWTAVIPAAGKGSRLGFDKPKILYPVAGRTMLDWIVDFLEPYCGTLVFVLSPSGADSVEQALRERGVAFRTAIQETPTGMGDAVSLGLAQVSSPHVAIVWGDQAVLRRESVEKCLRVHTRQAHPADATVPTVMRAAPYIHFERDSHGKLVGLRQAREGDIMPAIGESDTGFFCFRTRVLRKALDELRGSGVIGRQTREFNMLPAIPLIAQTGRVLTPQAITPEETIGVNSVEDAELVAQILGERHRSTLPLSKVA